MCVVSVSSNINSNIFFQALLLPNTFIEKFINKINYRNLKVSLSNYFSLYVRNFNNILFVREGVLRDFVAGHAGLLDPLGIFKPKAQANSQANAQSLGAGFNIGPVGVGGGFSSSSASASANGDGSASAKADAQAQAQGGYGGYGNSNAQASANANAQGTFIFVIKII